MLGYFGRRDKTLLEGTDAACLQAGVIEPPDADQVRRWIRDLDSDRFAVRDRAVAELAKLGDAAEPALRQALRDRPSLEKTGSTSARGSSPLLSFAPCNRLRC